MDGTDATGQVGVSVDSTGKVPHVHTATCCFENLECAKARIIELENMLATVQLSIRAVGGAVDKLDSGIRKVYPRV